MPIEILMPALSPTMTEGNLAKWLKKEGDEIGAGDVIAEIETDKATMEVEAVDEGTLGKIVIDEGETGVAVNSVIGLLLEEGEDKSALDGYEIKQPDSDDGEEDDSDDEDDSKDSNEENKKKNKEDSKKSDSKKNQMNNAPTKAPTKSSSSSAPSSSKSDDRSNFATTTITSDDDKDVNASPVARRLASSYGVSLSAIEGSGPKGRVVKEDVEKYLAKGGSGDVIKRNPDEFDRFENSNMRQVIAKRLLESKQQVPHFYLTVECNVDSLSEIRQQINETAPKDDNGKPVYKVSVNDLIIKASALALRDVPEANASWYDDAIVRYNNVDISVAVATDGGLITPIIFNADQKSILSISAEVKDLAKRARENSLKPEEFQGGGFSISNLGMYGIKQFSAIINPPQSCIMAVGTTEDKPVIKDGNLVNSKVMNVTLSVDHRSVDGAVGANYLQAFKKYIENPASLLV
jgi:pyruvate dehydrogenase E2 component (dihydrolipoamide acetyltransferase)